MSPERRRRTRVDIHLQAEVEVSGRSIEVESHNLSLKGMLCSPDEALVENQACRVILSLNADPEGQPVQAVMEGRIVRSTPEEAAIDFTVMDADSFLHLKRIVEYHTQEPEKITHELLTSAFPPTYEN
jgi:hypothetical protein